MGIFGLITPDELAAALAAQHDADAILWTSDIRAAMQAHIEGWHPAGPTGPTGPTGGPTGPTGPGPTGPTGTAFELRVPAAAFQLSNSQGFKLTGDHISDWGHPGETASVLVSAREATGATLTFDYVLAREAGAAESLRSVSVGQGVQPVTFLATCDTWLEGFHAPVAATVAVTAGESLLQVAFPEAVDWSNWLDLYEVVIRSEKEIVIAASEPGGGPTGPPPPPPPLPGGGVILAPDMTPIPVPDPFPGGKTIVSPRDGSAANCILAAAPGDVVVFDGVLDVPGKLAQLANRDNGEKHITLHWLPGALTRCQVSGFEGFGSMRGWWFNNANVEVSGGSYYGCGLYIDGHRTDMGGDGQGAANIRYRKCRVRPIPGTGSVQRDGLTVWGADLIEVSDIDVEFCGWNNLGFLGGAGSGVSIGITMASPLPTPDWMPYAGMTTFEGRAPGAPALPPIRVVLARIRGFHMRGDGTASYDRNALILDLYQQQSNARRVRGTTIVEDLDFGDLEGRGFIAGWAGDAPTLVRRVRGVAPYATNLAGSLEGGVVGYGGGFGNWIEVYDADVADSGGKANFLLEGFQGSPGVFGARNKVGPNGRAVGVPAGFIG